MLSSCFAPHCHPFTLFLDLAPHRFDQCCCHLLPLFTLACRQTNELTNPLDGAVRQGSSCSNVPFQFLFRRIIPVDLFVCVGGVKPPTSRQKLWPHIASGSIFGQYGNHRMCIHHPKTEGQSLPSELLRNHRWFQVSVQNLNYGRRGTLGDNPLSSTWFDLPAYFGCIPGIPMVRQPQFSSMYQAGFGYILQHAHNRGFGFGFVTGISRPDFFILCFMILMLGRNSWKVFLLHGEMSKQCTLFYVVLYHHIMFLSCDVDLVPFCSSLFWAGGCVLLFHFRTE